MNTPHRPFPWGDFALIMFQAVGILFGCLAGVAIVFFGAVAIAAHVTKYATRFGAQTARVVRAILISAFVVVPPVVVLIWMLATGGLPAAAAIPMAGVTFCGTGSIGVIMTMESRKVLDKYNSTYNCSGN